MPRLWNDTIEAHRRDVSDAILNATATLVAEHGLLSVSMSEIATRAGIGRATLYKYFPDVEAILLAWHGREIGGHLAQLAEARDQAAAPGKRLEAVLETFAMIAHASHHHHDTDLSVFLHEDQEVVRAQRQVRDLIRDLVKDGVARGDLRSDIAADELATYCLHALAAAGSLPSRAAVRRLVAVTLDGLRPSA